MASFGPTRPSKRSFLALGAALAAAGAVAGCGGGGGDDADKDPATAAPADAPVYVEATIRPEGKQKDDLEAAAKKLSNESDPGKRLIEEFDKSAKEDDLSYEKDLKPWLGERAAFFLNSLEESGPGDEPTGALVVAVTDEGKAKDTIEKSEKNDDGDESEEEYEGVDYFKDENDGDSVGVTDGFLIGGNEDGFKGAVDTLKGDGKRLADSSNYKDAIDGLPEDPVATAYADIGLIFDQASKSQTGQVQPEQLEALKSQLGDAAEEPAVAALTADGDKVALETISGETNQGDGDSQPSGLLAELPGDSFAALAINGLGETVQQGFDQLGSSGVEGLDADSLEQQIESQTGFNLQDDLLSWLGDVAFFARGDSITDVGGGAVIESTDPAASEKAIEQLQKLIEKQGEGVSIGKLAAGTGFEIKSPQLPQPVQVEARDDRVVIAYGTDAVDETLDPDTPLNDSESFKKAESGLGEGFEASGFAAMAPILELVESSGNADAEFEQAKPYLENIDYFVFGGKHEGGKQAARIVLGLD